MMMLHRTETVCHIISFILGMAGSYTLKKKRSIRVIGNME